MKKMRVALIFPRVTGSISTIDNNFWLTDKVKHLLNMGKTNYTPPLSLLMIAAVTPSEVEVVVIDERLEEIDFEMDVDIVGITVVTRTAFHAYDIADRFRQRNIKVVLGGIHPTVLTKEALQHADSVVRGEAEAVWPKLLQDFSEGNMQKIYEAKYNFPIESLPFPRRDLIRYPELYMTTKVITATRGCPYRCTFCTTGTTLGKQYRMRPISNIIKELESIPGRILILFDDNLGVNVSYAKEFFTALKSLRLRWYGSMSVNALEDMHLVKLIADSGCISLGIGLESLDDETLKMMGKRRTNNPDRYSILIRRLHDHNIPIVACFVLGYDTENTDTYRRLADFIEDMCIERPNINILIPYPGTPIFRQLDQEGRILHKNWDLYDTAGAYITYSPKKMTSEELIENYLALMERIFSYQSIMHRLVKVGNYNPFSIAFTLHHHYQNRQSVAMEKAAFWRNNKIKKK